MVAVSDDTMDFDFDTVKVPVRDLVGVGSVERVPVRVGVSVIVGVLVPVGVNVAVWTNVEVRELVRFEGLTVHVPLGLRDAERSSEMVSDAVEV